MWRFEYPQVLLVLLIVPLFVYLLYYRKARGGKITYSFSIWKGDRFKAAATTRRVLLIVTRVLFWIGFSLLVVALAKAPEPWLGPDGRSGCIPKHVRPGCRNHYTFRRRPKGCPGFHIGQGK